MVTKSQPETDSWVKHFSVVREKDKDRGGVKQLDKAYYEKARKKKTPVLAVESIPRGLPSSCLIRGCLFKNYGNSCTKIEAISIGID